MGLRVPSCLGFACIAAPSIVLASCVPPPVAPTDPGPPLPVVEHLAQQEILTPLPLRVGLPARYHAEHVLVFVHLWGAHDWKALELDRVGQTWSGEVSCRQVSAVTGDTRYFFLALDRYGAPVVGSGSPEWPHVATIVGKLPDGPRGLPGEARPMRCHDPADCPADFPGCPAYAAVRPSCTSDDECASGARCAWDHYCEAVPEPIVTVTDEEQLAAAVRHATKRYQTASGR